MRSKSFTTKLIPLLLFIVFWLIELKLTIDNNRNYMLITRMGVLVSLGFYYQLCVSKVNKIFILFLATLMLTGVFFSFNDYGIYAMMLFILSRIILIKFLISYKNKLDKKTLLSIMALFGFSIGLILFVLYKNTFFYYLSALAAFFLIILLSISFTRVLTLGIKDGNLELFFAISIFLISDALFGSQKITGTNLVYVMLSASFYYVSYFLITQFVIKQNE